MIIMITSSVEIKYFKEIKSIMFSFQKSFSPYCHKHMFYVLLFNNSERKSIHKYTNYVCIYHIQNDKRKPKHLKNK